MMDSKRLCSNGRPMLEAYLQKELETVVLKQMEMHVMSCPDCQDYCREIEKMNKLLFRALTLSTSPENLTDRILATIQQQGRANQS